MTSFLDLYKKHGLISRWIVRWKYYRCYFCNQRLLKLISASHAKTVQVCIGHINKCLTKKKQFIKTTEFKKSIKKLAPLSEDIQKLQVLVLLHWFNSFQPLYLVHDLSQHAMSDWQNMLQTHKLVIINSLLKKLALMHIWKLKIICYRSAAARLTLLDRNYVCMRVNSDQTHTSGNCMPIRFL